MPNLPSVYNNCEVIIQFFGFPHPKPFQNVFKLSIAIYIYVVNNVNKQERKQCPPFMIPFSLNHHQSTDGIIYLGMLGSHA